MVDWLTVELPDPVGLPVNAGQVLSMSEHGEVEWLSPKRKSVQGSWASNMTFRAIGQCGQGETHPWFDAGPGRGAAGLVVSGNPAKFLNGHNLFGTDDVAALLDGTMRKAKDAIWPDLFDHPQIDLSEGQISRIDLTASWVVDRADDVMPVLRAMEETVWCPFRGRGVFDAGGSTLYYGRTAKGKRAKDWALKLYWKGAEVSQHPLPLPAYDVPEIFEELNRTIRVELTLRSPELKRLGMRRVQDWTPAKVRQVWEAYVSKLNFGAASVNLDTADLGSLGLKPRHQHAVAAWMAGNDLRAGMSRPSFYRLRRELLGLTGHDIAAQRPKSNVVPLRRLVTVTPAQHPRWADQLTAALERAA